jgi:hypothetical protein
MELPTFLGKEKEEGVAAEGVEATAKETTAE